MNNSGSEHLINNFKYFANICSTWNPLQNNFSYRKFTDNRGSLENIGPKTAIKRLDQEIFDYHQQTFTTIKNDFAGLYLFLNDNKPFYCGISRNVIKRILNHQKGTTSSMATLAHRIAKKRHPDTSESKYLAAFNGEREKLLECDVALIKFYDPDYEAYKNDQMAQHKEEIMLYLFEVFVSVHYNTEHNSFRTH